MCRATDSGWGDNLILEQKLNKAREEVKIRLQAIVVCGPDSIVEDILTTAKSLKNQNPPIHTNFVLTSNKPKSATVISSLRKLFPQTSNLSWNVKLLYERREGKPLEKGEASDTVIRNINRKDCQFYVLIDPGATVWDTFSADIDNAVNDRLERFVYLHPVKEDNGKEIGPVIHTLTHITVGGNALAERDIEIDGKIETIQCNSVLSKIELLAKDQNLTYLIKDLYSLCPQE